MTEFSQNHGLNDGISCQFNWKPLLCRNCASSLMTSTTWLRSRHYSRDTSHNNGPLTDVGGVNHEALPSWAWSSSWKVDIIAWIALTLRTIVGRFTISFPSLPKPPAWEVWLLWNIFTAVDEMVNWLEVVGWPLSASEELTRSSRSRFELCLRLSPKEPIWWNRYHSFFAK